MIMIEQDQGQINKIGLHTKLKLSIAWNRFHFYITLFSSIEFDVAKKRLH